MKDNFVSVCALPDPDYSGLGEDLGEPLDKAGKRGGAVVFGVIEEGRGGGTVS